MRHVHLTLKAQGGLPMPVSPVVRRRLFRSLGERLLLFAFADNHGHFVIVDTPGELPTTVGLAKRIVSIGAQVVVDSHVESIRDQRHADNASRYVLRQGARHRLGSHPATSPEHAFADLVGARRTPGFDAEHFYAWRRRWRRADVWRALDLHPPAPVAIERIDRLWPTDLLELALDAFAVLPTGDRRLRSDARRATAQLADRAGWPGPRIAAALGLSRQRLWGLLREPCLDAALAVQKQLIDAGRRWIAERLGEAGGRSLSC